MLSLPPPDCRFFVVVHSLNHVRPLWLHGLQHARLPCPSLSHGVGSNSCPFIQWCTLMISFSAVPFSFRLQSFPASGSFPMSQLFASGRQSIGTSFSASVLPMIIHSWFLLGLIGLISLLSKGLWRVFSSTTVQNHQFFGAQPSKWSRSQHPYMTTGKTIALTTQASIGKVMSLLFNRLSRFVIAFLPRSKRLLISWLQLPSAVILKPKKIKSLTVSTVSPSICHEVMVLDATILVFWMLSFKPSFHSCSLSSWSPLVLLHFLP